ncbi:MAG: thioredoxin fold domain-containing protein [Chthoniobacterales bacterium]
MKNLHQRIGAAAVVLLFVAAASAAADSSWLTDIKQAQQQAKNDNKLVLLDFTGSDWCGWCIKLNREVFSKPEFKEYASKNLVLMEVDFPRQKKLDTTLQEQNEHLAQQYHVAGFPTLVILNGDGKKIGELDYSAAIPPGSQEAKATAGTFIAELEKLRRG